MSGVALPLAEPPPGAHTPIEAVAQVQAVQPRVSAKPP